MSNHAKLSPSSAERWFNCPGSLNLIATLPEAAFVTSKYASEGTVAHQLAEDFVSRHVDLATLISRVGEVVMQDGHEIEISDAMIEGVIEYVDHIAAVKKTLLKPASTMGRAEVRVRASSVSEEVYGTADYILAQKGNELHVFDFKFGKEVVEAEENKQGLIYVLGALDEIKAPFDKYFFHIVQPRARHADGTVRTFEISPHRLEEFRNELLVAVARTREQTAPRVAGSWCKFCPALGHCAEAAARVQDSVETVFTKLPAPPSKEVGATSLPPVAALTPEQVARALDWEDTVDSWFEAVRERALAALTLDAKAIPGYKLVEGKTNRQWANEAQVEAAMAMLGDDRYAPRKLKSPAQMEKLAGKDAVAPLTVKPAGKPTVAPLGDKREAMPAAGVASEVFGTIEMPSGSKITVARSLPEDAGHGNFPVPNESYEDVFGDLMGAPAPVPLAKVKTIWP